MSGWVTGFVQLICPISDAIDQIQVSISHHVNREESRCSLNTCLAVGSPARWIHHPGDALCKRLGIPNLSQATSDTILERNIRHPDQSRGDWHTAVGLCLKQNKSQALVI